jgi:peptide/nickel transport system substrate-binding protein
MLSTVGCSTQQIIDSSSEGSQSDTSSAKAVSTVNDNTLRISMFKPDTLNPLENRDISVDRVLRLIFEPLFVIDDNMQVVPQLADSYSVSNDGKSVSIKLKSGVKWQDGESVTASDIVFSVNTMLNAADDSCYKTMAENIDSAYVKDDLTAVITYKAPVGAVGYSLCFPIIPKHYYKKTDTDPMKPIGNGLYSFESYRLVNNMTLVASNNCYRGKAAIPSIYVTVLRDEATDLSAFENRITDVLITDPVNIGRLNSDRVKNASIYNTNKLEYMCFNMKKEMFADVSVRQAIAHLIPFDDIVGKVYVNYAVKSVTPINPANANVSMVGVDSYDYDQGAANTLILASGRQKANLSFTILVNSDNIQRVETAQLISSTLNLNGLNTSVEQVSFDEYTKRLTEGNFDVYLGGVNLRENYNLYSLLHSEAINGGLNYSGYSDAEMDRLIALCNNSASDESYKAALNELNKYCSANLPIIGLCFRCEALITDSKVEGNPAPALGNIYGNINEWSLTN